MASKLKSDHGHKSLSTYESAKREFRSGGALTLLLWLVLDLNAEDYSHPTAYTAEPKKPGPNFQNYIRKVTEPFSVINGLQYKT